MTLFLLGLIVFFATHAVPMLPGVRAGLTGSLGVNGYRAAHSIIAVVAVALIAKGYGDLRAAGAQVLWQPPGFMRHITMLLMLPVFPLALASIFGGKIRATVKHPLITAVKLWAFAHLLANGTLPAVILFGAFLAWGVIDRISLKRRGVAPPAPVAGFTAGDWASIGLGLVLYVLVLLKLHLWLIGVTPFGTLG